MTFHHDAMLSSHNVYMMLVNLNQYVRIWADHDPLPNDNHTQVVWLCINPILACRFRPAIQSCPFIQNDEPVLILNQNVTLAE